MKSSRVSASANSAAVLGLLLSLGASPALALGRRPPEPAFQLDPAVVTAGHTLSIRFQAPPALQVPRVSSGDRTAYFFHVSSDTWRVLWGVGSQEEPGPKTLRFEAFWKKKTVVSTVSFSVQAGTYPISHIPLTKKQDNLFTSGQLAADNKTLAAAYDKAVTPDKLWEGLFVYPTTGVISSVFGARRAYGNRPPGSGHSGTDIAAPEGTPIFAPAPGRVAFSGWLDSFGNVVLLDHGHGVLTYYLHMKERRAAEGDLLKTGSPIGLMGKEGLATGPHLHWSMVVGGERVNALEWTERVFE